MTISLSFLGCKSLPEFPEILQCGAYANVNPPGYYCVNTKTKEKSYFPFEHERMRAAQCMSADDYKKTEDWVSTVKEIAKSQCEAQ